MEAVRIACNLENRLNRQFSPEEYSDGSVIEHLQPLDFDITLRVGIYFPYLVISVFLSFTTKEFCTFYGLLDVHPSVRARSLSVSQFPYFSLSQRVSDHVT